MIVKGTTLILLVVGLWLVLFSCAREQLLLDVEIEDQLTIVDDTEKDETKAESTAELTITKTEVVSAGNSEQPFAVTLYISFKAKIDSENEDIQEVYSDSIEIKGKYDNPYKFSYKVDRGELKAGTYWVEYSWIDDAGYHLEETKEAEYEG